MSERSRRGVAMSGYISLPGARYDPVYKFALVGEDCLLASFAAAILGLDTSLEAVADLNSVLTITFKDSVSYVQAAGWTDFAYSSIKGLDNQEWPLVNRRQALMFMASLDNSDNDNRTSHYKRLCDALGGASSDAEDELDTMKQAQWNLRRVYEATDGRYLKDCHTEQAPVPAVTPPGTRMKPFPHSLYSQPEYKQKYRNAVKEFLQRLSPEEKEMAVLSKPDCKSDSGKCFDCPMCQKSTSRQSGMAKHMSIHPELHGVEIVFYSVVYSPQTDEVSVDAGHPVKWPIVRPLSTFAPRTPQQKSSTKKRQHPGSSSSPRKLVSTQFLHAPQSRADTARIMDLQTQLADAKVATAEAHTSRAVAEAEGLKQLLAEKHRQDERLDQAQKVKDAQINELVQITKQQSEAANTMTKALALDHRSIRVKSVEAAQTTSNEYHAFNNASRPHGA